MAYPDIKNAEKTMQTLTFPSTLRSQVADGAAHVRFKSLDKNDTGQAIHLFVPQGFSLPDAQAYTTMDLGIMGGLERAKNALITSGKTDLNQSDLEGAASKAGSIIGSFFGGSQSGVGAALGGMHALRKGYASNPYTETQYTGSTVRSFGFTFKLVSESSDEADVALAIENFFRDNMYPEIAGDFTLNYPNKFKIEFFNGDSINKYLPLIRESYLVSLNTTYNSTTNAFHDSGQPVEIDIAATFQETKALTKEELDPAYVYPEYGDLGEYSLNVAKDVVDAAEKAVNDLIGGNQ